MPTTYGSSPMHCMHDVQLACRNLKGNTSKQKGNTPGAGSKPRSSGGAAKPKGKNRGGKKPTTKKSKAAPKEAA